ncbi:LysR family transcriptional regulator [Leucothrix mucor]|uniref:LysR family transcriptional regulator n=1 Tax=Leucothrix mucor TaxID=45248 RepID=UPI0003B54673|nr:LysR family transcriptional regulator [Leucothrix mucor]
MKNDQLKAFVAVVEHGSFRAAASALFKTQSTVSASVKTLETEFGVQLFNRDAYRPSLTSAGKVFYRDAKKLVAQVHELEVLGHQLATGIEQRLSICLSAVCVIPPELNTVKRFSAMHPDMRLSISTGHMSGVLEGLRLEKTDLAIGPHHGLDDRYEFQEISQIHMTTVAAPNYIPVGPDTLISQAQMRQYPHILISDTGTSPLDHVNVLTGGQRWFVNDYHIKKTLILASMGWARIPAHMVQREVADGRLVELAIENFNYTGRMPIYLIRLRGHPHSELAREFWDEVVSNKQ